MLRERRLHGCGAGNDEKMEHLPPTRFLTLPGNRRGYVGEGKRIWEGAGESPGVLSSRNRGFDDDERYVYAVLIVK